MKKVLFGLGVVAALSFPVVGMAYGEENQNYLPQLKQSYVTDNELVLEALFKADIESYDTFDIIDNPLIGEKKFNLVDIGKSNDYYDEEYKSLYYPLSIKAMNELKGEYCSEVRPDNIDFLRHFHSLDEIYAHSSGTDFRPLENSRRLKNLNIDGPITSFEFLKKIPTLEILYIWTSNELETYYDSTIKALTDISFLTDLNRLEEIDIHSEKRPFPTVSLKKSMNKYALVNPFILSKQFKNPEIKITSKTPGFTFEDDILTWDGITPETKELQISWEFKSQKNERGNYDFEFEGNSVIPINWID